MCVCGGVCACVFVLSTIRGPGPEYTRNIRGRFQSEDFLVSPRFDLTTASYSACDCEPFYILNKEKSKNPRIGLGNLCTHPDRV